MGKIVLTLATSNTDILDDDSLDDLYWQLREIISSRLEKEIVSPLQVGVLDLIGDVMIEDDAYDGAGIHFAFADDEFLLQNAGLHWYHIALWLERKQIMALLKDNGLKPGDEGIYSEAMKGLRLDAEFPMIELNGELGMIWKNWNGLEVYVGEDKKYALDALSPAIRQKVVASFEQKKCLCDLCLKLRKEDKVHAG